MTTDAGIVISDVIVGPGQVMPVPAVGTWQTFTPSLTNISTSAIAGKYRRISDSMEIQVQATVSSAASGGIRVTIPSDYSIDTSALASSTEIVTLGSAYALDTGTAYYIGSVISIPGDADEVQLVGYNNGALWNATQPFTWASGDKLSVIFTVPIAEWAGAPNYAGQNDVEYASVGGTWDAASSTTVYGPSGVQMGGALTAQRIKTVTFLSTIQPTDAIEIQMSRDGVVWTPMIGSVTTAGRIVSSMTNNAGSLMGAAWEKNSANSILVYFGRYSSVENDDGAGYDWGTDYWRVVKTRAGAAVGFGLADTSGRAGLVNPYTEGSGVVYSGTYTPTLTNLTNIDASTAFKLQYMRVGKVVTVSGIVNIDPSASGDIDLRMSLPSGLDMSTEATVPAGGAASGEGADNLGIDKASTTAVRFLGNPVTRTNRTYRFIFMYRMD
jgi:hypothetical protein